MGIPKKIRSWLEKKSWYLRARYSTFFLNGWTMIRRDVRKELNAQHHFYKNLLGKAERPLIVFDIGANEGFHTQIFKSIGYHVVAVEPLPRNVAILNARFKNDPFVTIVAAAASHQPGSVNFYGNENDHALGTASAKRNDEQQKAETLPVTSIPSVTLDLLIQRYGLPKYIKIDVEGYEEAVLQSLTKEVEIISFEAMLPSFLAESKHCIERLEEININAKFNYTRSTGFALPHFVSPGDICNTLEKNDPGTLNIFCINK